MEDGGEVWERLLLSIPSPFLALSASVAKADEFVSWLQKVRTNTLSRAVLQGNKQVKLQSSEAPPVTKIVHTARWTDHRKWIYSPLPDAQNANKILSSSSVCSFFRII